MCCIDNDFNDGHKVFIKKNMLYQYQRNQRVLQMNSVFISKKLTRLLTLIVFFSLVNILVYFGNKLLNFSLLFLLFAHEFQFSYCSSKYSRFICKKFMNFALSH